MSYIINIFDLLLSVSSQLPAPILFGFSLFLVVGLLRVIIDLL